MLDRCKRLVYKAIGRFLFGEDGSKTLSCPNSGVVCILCWGIEARSVSQDQSRHVVRKGLRSGEQVNFRRGLAVAWELRV